ncbi:MAG: hypothetical protein HQL19_06705 [Candidatus Omnitrophica bacterium]|nr:hypothetical protein [Candidatus Omnitrophota bacterium]
MKKITALFVVMAFLMSCIMPPQGFAQVLSAVELMPVPGVQVGLSAAFTPAHLKGMVIDARNPFKFDVIIHHGDEVLSDTEKQVEYAKLVKYFLAALAVPDTDQWVNLSPYEKDRIIPNNFGLTEMGRDLLAQDYLLKQITATLTSPNNDLGKKFWDRVYEESYKRFGATEVPADIFNKVWILPDKAEVYEKGNAVYVTQNHLKVMIDTDYLAQQENSVGAEIVSANERANTRVAPTHELTQNILREVIIPALEKEVNEGKNFAPLRQVYSGMLLATWYKRTLKESILNRVYGDHSRVKGIDQDPARKRQIYGQYVQAFHKGVFNMIREDMDRYSGEIIPKKYFSGGTRGFESAMISKVPALGLLTFSALSLATVILNVSAPVARAEDVPPPAAVAPAVKMTHQQEAIKQLEDIATSGKIDQKFAERCRLRILDLPEWVEWNFDAVLTKGPLPKTISYSPPTTSEDKTFRTRIAIGLRGRISQVTGLEAVNPKAAKSGRTRNPKEYGRIELTYNLDGTLRDSTSIRTIFLKDVVAAPEPLAPGPGAVSLPEESNKAMTTTPEDVSVYLLGLVMGRFPNNPKTRVAAQHFFNEGFLAFNDLNVRREIVIRYDAEFRRNNPAVTKFPEIETTVLTVQFAQFLDMMATILENQAPLKEVVTLAMEQAVFLMNNVHRPMVRYAGVRQYMAVDLTRDYVRLDGRAVAVKDMLITRVMAWGRLLIPQRRAPVEMDIIEAWSPSGSGASWSQGTDKELIAHSLGVLLKDGELNKDERAQARELLIQGFFDFRDNAAGEGFSSFMMSWLHEREQGKVVDPHVVAVVRAQVVYLIQHNFGNAMAGLNYYSWFFSKLDDIEKDAMSLSHAGLTGRQLREAAVALYAKSALSGWTKAQKDVFVAMVKDREIEEENYREYFLAVADSIDDMNLAAIGRDRVRDGGINFAQSNLDLIIKRDGNGMPLAISRQDLEHIHIDGLVPSISNIRPLTEGIL